MAVCIRLPRLGANVVEGTVGAWRRRVGDNVRAGEPLVEIITSKATFDVESPADGVLRKVLAPEKSNVPVGYILAIVGESGEELPDVSAENKRLLAEFRAQALQVNEKTVRDEGSFKRVRATFSWRRRAPRFARIRPFPL